jgi:hypothetical protein
MSQATSVSDGALRIVLAGLPGSGKSSLLSALAQAARSQEPLLHGRLQGLPGSPSGPADGNKESPRIADESVAYPLRFEAFDEDRPSGLEAVLVDGDGCATQLLFSKGRILDQPPANSLAAAIRSADALVFVLEASADVARLDTELDELGDFLQHLRASRGRDLDPGGLPVFVVLTKCDLLAGDVPSSAVWLRRIEEYKARAEHRFLEYVPAGEPGAPLAFGTLRLHLAATAIHRPALAETPAHAGEPYGVAEWFRHCLHAAQAFQDRRRRARVRLLGTSVAALALVALMLTFSALLLHKRTVVPPSELQARVQAYRAREAATPSARLREPLQSRIGELADLQNDPEFVTLPAADQRFVESRRKELEEYHQFWQKLQGLRPPAEATSERELEQINASLQALTPPADHRTDWEQTEAAHLRRQRLLDFQAIRAAATSVQDWNRGLIRRGEDLWATAGASPKQGPVDWPQWHEKVRSILTEAANPPFDPASRIPGQTQVTYATVHRFDRVSAERFRWEETRQRLERVRDLSAALGLGGDVRDPLLGPAVLAIPSPSLFTLDQATARLQELEKRYPNWSRDFQLPGLPDAVIPEVRKAARTSYDNLIEAARRVVLHRLVGANPGGPVKPEDWQTLRRRLAAAPDELRSFRPLANLLLRLDKPEAPDPVPALETFLAQQQFPIEVGQLTLSIPDELSVRPVGPFTIHHHGTEGQVSLAFEMVGEGRRDGGQQATTYTFRRSPAATLIYRPGDTLWADLPLQDQANSDWVLTWARNRAQDYQFERLTLPPRLHRKGQEYATGRYVPGVTLTVRPEGGVPAVPDLLPVVPAQ